MSVGQPAGLAAALNALLAEAHGCQPGGDALDVIGGWQRVADEAATLADDPRLLPLVRLVTRDAATRGDEAGAAVRAATSAVLASDSPALFGDCLNALLASPAALQVVGNTLVDALLETVNGFQQLAAPDAAAVSRAADALEAVTRLKVGAFGTPFGLFAALEQFRAPVPKRLAVAAIRAVGTAVDHWPEAKSLDRVVRIQAGLDAAEGSMRSGVEPEDVASDAAWVLASIELVRALRTDDLTVMAERMSSSREYLQVARDSYEREDAGVLSDVLEMVSALIAASNGEPTVAGLDTPLLEPEAVDALIERANKFSVTSSGLEHWFGDAKRQSLVAWVGLANDLRRLRDEFSHDSFYRAEVVVDDLLQIYIASRSVAIVRCDDDLAGVLQIVQPVIESGFAAKAGLLAHLEQHTDNLEKRVERSEAEERAELSDELEVARKVLTAARGLAQRGGGSGKVEGGTAPVPLPRPLDRLLPPGSREAAEVAKLGSVALSALAVAVENQSVSRKLTLMEADVVGRMRASLAASPDYQGEVAGAVDEVLTLLVRFVANRANAQSDRKKYLFDPDAREDNLQQDLYDYLLSTDLGAKAEMEVQHIGGGRVDIRIQFDGFGLHIELKADDTMVPMTDKSAYLKQAVAYQTTDVRIGFLVALRLKAFDSTGPSPHLTALFEHTTFDVTGDSRPRHIVLVQVPGNRTKPSRMK
jgi:hypothetical protein